MKLRILHIILCVSITLGAFEVCATDFFEKGTLAYEKKNYNEAARNFQIVAKNQPRNVSAFYNLGLVHRENHKYGLAIWAFEKVLKLSPNDDATKQLIENCRLELFPHLEWKPRLNFFQSSLYSISSNTWAFLAIAFSLLFCLSFILHKRQKSTSMKKIMIICSVGAACLLITSVVLSSQIQRYQNEESFAIVTQKSIPTFVKKGKTAKDTVSEGSYLKIVDTTAKDFILVKNESEEQFLVKRKDISFV